MLVPKTINKSRTIILVIIIAINLVLIAYFIFGYYFGFGDVNLSSGSLSGPVISQPRPVLELEFKDDFLNKEPYRNFEQYGRLPVEIMPSELGRNNPFQPVYSVSSEAE